MGQPVSDPNLRAKLDGDVTPDEVWEALKRLRNDAAAVGVPVRAMKMLCLAEDNGYTLAGLAKLLSQYIRGDAALSEEAVTVNLHPLLKPGKDPASKDSYRTIGYGITLSRVLQSVIARRLQAHITTTGCLHRAQAGFMPRLSADMLCWLSNVISEDATLAHAPLFRCFVDVKAAFASTRHVDVAASLVKVGITGKLSSLILSFLSRSKVYIVEEGYRTSPVNITVGLVEGCVFSPILWNIVMNDLLVQVDVAMSTLLDAGLQVAPLLVAGSTLPSAAYADDLLLLCHSVLVAQTLVDTTVTWMTSRQLELGVAPDKTAALTHPSLRGQNFDALTVAGRVMPLVERYKYLGLQVHHAGPRSSADAHRSHLLSRLWAVLGDLRGSGLRDLRPQTGLVAYLTRIRPLLTYGLAIWGLEDPAKLISELGPPDMLAPALIMDVARHFPHAVISSTLCIPSLECELDRAVLRMVLRVLSLPPDNMFRMVLARLCRQWKEALSVTTDSGIELRRALRTTWWPRALARLQRLDDVQSQLAPNCPYVDTGVRFVKGVERALLGSLDAVGVSAIVARMNHTLRYVTDWRAWQDNQTAMDSRVSLACTRDLLLGRPCDGRLPFLHLNRSVYQTYAMHLPAGVTYLLGHQHIDATCPWCRDVNYAVSIPHLLRDCTFWAPDRQRVVTDMRRAAIAQGVMSSDVPDVATDPAFATAWYHLMVGRPVPYRVNGVTFFDVPLFHCMAPGAKERVERRPPFAVGALSKYAKVLQHAQSFVVEVLSRTQRVFGVESQLVARNLDRATARTGHQGLRDPRPLTGAAENTRRAARAALRHGG